jgi:hypothetical protein
MFEWLPGNVHLWDNLSVCDKYCDGGGYSCYTNILRAPRTLSVDALKSNSTGIEETVSDKQK